MEIKMPKLGESVHEGTIDQWLVQPGDTINEYDTLCEVITDKVTAEVPSTVSGTVREIIVEAGTTVAVGSVICIIETNAIEYKESKQVANHKFDQKEPSKVSEKPQKNNNQKKNHKNNNGRYSPVVFKLASMHEINLDEVVGTGFDGRVTKKDILQYIENMHQSDNSKALNNNTENNNENSSLKIEHMKNELIHNTNNAKTDQSDKLSINGVRRAIAQKMVQSVHEIPHAWMMVEVDVTNLVNVRNAHKNHFKEVEGYPLTYFSFFIKVIANALREYPMMYASWCDDHILMNKDINISIAVASDDKLYVPVIKNVDELSIKGIAKKVNEYATKGRQHMLSSDEMTGGTFTVNNTGAFGSVMSMGIINHPQAAILQIESIKKRVEVVDGNIGIRDMCHLCLSIDHRMLDGLMAGQFLNKIKQDLEQINPYILD